jgi:hypothetical protein
VIHPVTTASESVKFNTYFVYQIINKMSQRLVDEVENRRRHSFTLFRKYSFRCTGFRGQGVMVGLYRGRGVTER